MGLKLVTPPDDFPVTLAEAKIHLREDSTDFDTYIQALIEAATDYVDGPNGFLGRALLEQTWDYYLDTFTDQVTLGGRNYIEIPLPPLIEVEGVFYIDSSGTEQEFPSTNYMVDDSNYPARISLKTGQSWPSLSDEFNAVRIRFRAGYLDQSVSPAVSNVPRAVKAAIMLTIGTLYENRENEVVGTIVSKLPFAAEQLLRPYRVYLSLA